MVRVDWIVRGITFPLRDGSIESEELGYGDADGSEGQGRTQPGQEGTFWRDIVGEIVLDQNETGLQIHGKSNGRNKQR